MYRASSLVVVLLLLGSVRGTEPEERQLVRLYSLGGCGNAIESTVRWAWTDANAVVVGTLENLRVVPGEKREKKLIDLHVSSILKTHETLDKRALITILFDNDIRVPKNSPKYLLFLGLTGIGRELEVLHIARSSDALLMYVEGALKIDNKKPDQAAAYFMRHLDSTNQIVWIDANIELARQPYKVLRPALERLDPEILVGQLDREGIRPFYSQSYPIYLGHCGSAKHAEILLKKLQQSLQINSNRAVPAIIGYTMLKPAEGTALMKEIVNDPQRIQNQRYSVLQTLKFFQENRRDIIPAGTNSDIVAALFAYPDTADLAIEELRARKESRHLERVIALYGRKDYQDVLTRRAIVRFALTFQDKPAARTFIAPLKASDPELIEAFEESLRDEAKRIKE